MELYQYAVIKTEKQNSEGEVTEPAELVVPITSILARDEEQAQLLAARAIPEAEIVNLDRLVVVISPF